MKKEEFQAIVKTLDKASIKQSGGTVNAYLMAMYQKQTGRTDFRTFPAWKEAGYQVLKGESSYAIFSRPIGVLKELKGKEAADDDFKRFGVCHLFHDGQVKPIEDKIQAPESDMSYLIANELN